MIYRLVELLNQEHGAQIQAQICSYEGAGFSCSWFSHSAPIKQDYLFSTVGELAVLPECTVPMFGMAFLERQVPYAIFVQNGYYFDTRVSHPDLLRLYEGARFVISISDDTTECIRLKFPALRQTILPYRYVVSQDFSVPDQQKRKVITYMPRKMADQVQFVLSCLAPRLPPGWSLDPIDDVPESEVAARLRSSSIFLCFCDQEGLPVPPIEAGLSGNRVIGYHGEGGREYWDPRIFADIPKGNLIAFVERTLEALQDIDQGRWVPDPKAMGELRERYSEQRQSALAAGIVDFVGQKCEALHAGPRQIVDLRRTLARVSLVERARRKVERMLNTR